MMVGAEGLAMMAAAVEKVPTLTEWGKIFSFLLLAAIGVAYLVWRRPVERARAILETSPLGSQEPAVGLVDWGLYLKSLVGVEVLAFVVIVGMRFFGVGLTRVDVLGVFGCGAIVAFVVHLILLGRRGAG